MSKTIIIAGDSWGCGELDEHVIDRREIAHPGLATYFQEAGYQVVNLSQMGGGNKNSAESIDAFLHVNKHLESPCVIVFQTEWDRDILAEDPAEIRNNIEEGYEEFKNRAIAKFYYRLLFSSQRHGVPVYIVGGCGDADWLDKFETEYPGLRIVCQSLTNLLVKNDHRVLRPVYSTFGMGHETVIEYIKKHVSSADLELLIADIDAGNRRAVAWQDNKKYFWPDGYHPNREGHRVLFEFLKKQIPGL